MAMRDYSSFESGIRLRCVLAGILGALLLLFPAISTAYVGDLHGVWNSSHYIKLADISYNPNTEKYLVVWEETYLGNTDVWGRIINKDGSPATNGFLISWSTDDEEHPRVAYANSSGWVAVWSQRGPITYNIRACRVDDSGNLSNYNVITEGFNYRIKPDIGGSSVNDQYLIVWQELNNMAMSEIRGRPYSATAGPQGEELTIGNSIGYERKNPSINQRGNNYFVAWEKHVNTTRVDIEGRWVACIAAEQGDLDQDEFIIIGDGGKNLEPSVACHQTYEQFLVAWQHEFTEIDYDIHYSFVSTNSVLSSGVISETTRSEIRPCAVYTGQESNYVVSYAKMDADWNIYAQGINASGSVGNLETITYESREDGSPEGTTVGGAYGKVLITWDRGQYGDAIAARYWSYTALPQTAGPWTAMVSGTSVGLEGVWGSSSSDVFTVGAAGTIVHYDGNSWWPMISGTDKELTNVHGLSASEVFAVGYTNSSDYEGILLHFDGAGWETATVTTDYNKSGLWCATPTEVYLAGQFGSIHRYNGVTTSKMSTPNNNSLLGMSGVPGGDMYAAGHMTILKYNGFGWSQVYNNSSYVFRGIWGASSSDVFVVGSSGRIMHYNGSNWSTIPNTGSENLNAIWGASANSVYVVGDNGTILYHDGDTWTTMDSGTTEDLKGVWGAPDGTVYAVGANGTILRHIPGCGIDTHSSGYENTTAAINDPISATNVSIGAANSVLIINAPIHAQLMSFGAENSTIVFNAPILPCGNLGESAFSIGMRGCTIRFGPGSNYGDWGDFARFSQGYEDCVWKYGGAATPLSILLGTTAR